MFVINISSRPPEPGLFFHSVGARVSCRLQRVSGVTQTDGRNQTSCSAPLFVHPVAITPGIELLLPCNKVRCSTVKQISPNEVTGKDLLLPQVPQPPASVRTRGFRTFGAGEEEEEGESTVRKSIRREHKRDNDQNTDPKLKLGGIKCLNCGK